MKVIDIKYGYLSKNDNMKIELKNGTKIDVTGLDHRIVYAIQNCNYTSDYYSNQVLRNVELLKNNSYYIDTHNQLFIPNVVGNHTLNSFMGQVSNIIGTDQIFVPVRYELMVSLDLSATTLFVVNHKGEFINNLIVKS